MSRLNSQQLFSPIWPYQINHASDQARGLAAWWPGNGGSRLFDLASGKHANAQGVAPFDALLPSQSTAAVRNVSATNNYWLVGDDPFAFSPLTFSCWFVTTSTSSAGEALMAWRDGGNAHIPLCIDIVTGNLRAFVGNGSYSLAQVAISTYREYHMAATVVGNAISLYLNGVLVGSSSAGTAPTSTALAFQIGRHIDGGTNSFSGWLSDVRVYQRALSAAEVYAQYDPATRYDLYWSPWLAVGGVGVADQTINPSRIESTAQLYAPTLTPGEVTVSPDFLASTATVYAPTLTPGEVTITPSRIESTAQLYAPTITFDQTVSPAFLASTAQLYAPTITNFTRSDARTYIVPLQSRRYVVPE